METWQPPSPCQVKQGSCSILWLFHQAALAELHLVLTTHDLHPGADPEFLYDESQEQPVLALTWHPSGSHLAILPRGQPFAMAWSAGGELARIDAGVKASPPLLILR
jgi:hypothetical protein